MTDALGPRPPRSRARLWVATLLLLVYAGFVSLVTLWPDPSDLQVGSLADRILAILHRFGVPDAFGFDELEFTANIGMFVPLGFFLGLALPRRGWWLALLLLPGYSGAIEYTQATALESRVSSVLDVLANTTGGYVGLLLAMVLRALIAARDRTVVARAIWERDAERAQARGRGRPAAAREQADPATRVFDPLWAQGSDEARTERLRL